MKFSNGVKWGQFSIEPAEGGGWAGVGVQHFPVGPEVGALQHGRITSSSGPLKACVRCCYLDGDSRTASPCDDMVQWVRAPLCGQMYCALPRPSATRSCPRQPGFGLT